MTNIEVLGLIADISVIGWAIFLIFAFACSFVVEYNNRQHQEEYLKNLSEEEEEEQDEEEAPQIVQFIDVRLPEDADTDKATITVQENEL